MKNFFKTFAFLAFFPVAASAQITIEADEIELIGFTAIRSNDATPDPTIVPGGSGMQTWDFTALKDLSRDTLTFLDPAETPYDTLFPVANIAAKLGANTYLYFEKTEDFLKIQGIYGPQTYQQITVTTGIDLDPGQVQLNFPAKFNNSHTQVVRGTAQIHGDSIVPPVPYDSVRFITTLERDVHIDAFGQLTTPTGQYETLRSTEIEISVDSFFIYSGFWFFLQATPPDTAIYYNWWTNQNGLGFPVVQVIDQVSAGNYSAGWLNEYVSGSKETKWTVQAKVSPNPASDFLQVELPETFRGSLEIYDFSGKLQMAQTSLGNLEKLNIGQLPTGSFVLVLKDEQGRMAGYERFEVLR